MIKRGALPISLVAGLALAPGAVAQEPSDELTPRAIADSTYAIRVAIDAFTEGLRRGHLDARSFKDAQLTVAVGTLGTAASNRTRQPPHAGLPVLWDLHVSVAGFEAEGPDVLRVRTHVLLATTADSGTAPVILTFRRRGDRWHFTAHEGLTARLLAIATTLDGRPHP